MRGVRVSRKVLSVCSQRRNLSYLYNQLPLGLQCGEIDYTSVSAKDEENLAKLESGGFIGLQRFINDDFQEPTSEDYQKDVKQLEEIESGGRPELVRWMKYYRD